MSTPDTHIITARGVVPNSRLPYVENLGMAHGVTRIRVMGGEAEVNAAVSELTERHVPVVDIRPANQPDPLDWPVPPTISDKLPH